MAEIINALGGLGGLAAFITSLATLSKVRTVKSDTTTLKPNHGTSVADHIKQIREMVSSLGHQVGEIRKDAAITHEDLLTRMRRLEAQQQKK